MDEEHDYKIIPYQIAVEMIISHCSVVSRFPIIHKVDLVVKFTQIKPLLNHFTVKSLGMGCLMI